MRNADIIVGQPGKYSLKNDLCHASNLVHWEDLEGSGGEGGGRGGRDGEHM